MAPTDAIVIEIANENSATKHLWVNVRNNAFNCASHSMATCEGSFSVCVCFLSETQIVKCTICKFDLIIRFCFLVPIFVYWVLRFGF